MNKGYITNIDIKNQKIGFDERQSILDGISDKKGFLPNSVFEEDLDKTFIDFVGNDNGLSLTINGEKVPVIFLTLQRWSEFTKTWKFTDEYKNINLPFITIVRKIPIYQGTNQAGLWNIPGDRTYTYMKVPTWDGIRKGVDLYKIPQPTSVDLTYEVRLFTNKMKDLNNFNRIVQKKFQSRQHYINVNGHPMPLVIEDIGDESNIEDFENRRFYVQLYEFKLMGYILDDKDFKVIPTINRTLLVTELMKDNVVDNNTILEPIVENSKAYFTFVFKPNAEKSFSFNSQYDLNFTQLINVENITRIVISKNGVGIFDGLVLTSPITIKNNDNITIRVYKTPYSLGKFQLVGNS